MSESTISDHGDRMVIRTGKHETAFRLSEHPDGESTAKCAATQIALLQQRIIEQDTIISKLPKCWRLFGHAISVDDPDAEPGPGKLVQDCPVVPGMKVWYLSRRREIVSAEVHAVTSLAAHVPLPGGTATLMAENLTNSYEAAEALQKERRFSSG